MTEAYIPYGAYWTTPFARWQGSLAHLHSLRFAAHVAKSELERRDIALDEIDYGVLGITVPQKRSFWGLPWVFRTTEIRSISVEKPVYFNVFYFISRFI